jgi:hypothetical protein
MKTIIKTCVATYLAVLGVSLAFFIGFAPKAFGVMPPPDGGYPNKNTAEGQDALFSLTNGTANTANGFSALKANTRGDRNTADGALALFTNVTGSDNTATVTRRSYSTGALGTRPTVLGRSTTTQPETTTRPMANTRSMTT